MSFQELKTAKKYSGAVFDLAMSQTPDYTQKDEAIAELKQMSAFADLSHKLKLKQKEEVVNMLRDLGIDDPHKAQYRRMLSK